MLSTLILSLAAIAAATPESTLRPWKAPSPGDSRGPCPMVNTLANHGYLPHNGRNVTVHHFAEAVVAALNVDATFGTKPSGMFVQGWGREYFDLEDLNTPGILQHIASLSREDVTPEAYTAKVNPNRVEALLADSPSDYVDIASIAKSRIRVEALSNPDKLNPKEDIIAYLEGSLVVAMMMENLPSALSFPSSKTYKASKERVRTWLTEERFPDELGWKRSERHIAVRDLAPMVKAVYDKKRSEVGGPSFWSWLYSVLVYRFAGPGSVITPLHTKDEL